eukprot:6269-Lingulodinium_polyedra.AAC.1
MCWGAALGGGLSGPAPGHRPSGSAGSRPKGMNGGPRAPRAATTPPTTRWSLSLTAYRAPRG